VFWVSIFLHIGCYPPILFYCPTIDIPSLFSTSVFISPSRPHRHHSSVYPPFSTSSFLSHSMLRVQVKTCHNSFLFLSPLVVLGCPHRFLEHYCWKVFGPFLCVHSVFLPLPHHTLYQWTVSISMPPLIYTCVSTQRLFTAMFSHHASFFITSPLGPSFCCLRKPLQNDNDAMSSPM